jgi:hypothetical protein
MKPVILYKWLLVIVLFLASPFSSVGYSVLTHEAIVDAAWDKSIVPLLRQKYPGATDAQLKEAHAYAYGGAITPDMGYFPFSSRFFTDLVHYVRSGDFVTALLDEASDINEYAFALGFLCHYMSDKYGHYLAINRTVPIVYPKMKTKYGEVVTYANDKVSHRRIEFSFDVLQTARGNYASQAYHDFIGFQVSRPVLERAFHKTYGLDITDVFRELSLSIGTFRWSVNNLFPFFTRMAWARRKNDILKSQPTATSQSFMYKMSRINYNKDFGDKRTKPGFFAWSTAWLIRVIPKLGPLSPLKIKEPGPEAEKLFIKSFDTVLLNCHNAMQALHTGKPQFENIDFDTGKDTAPGEYTLADKNYGDLLLKLSEKHFEQADQALKQNIIAFYQNAEPPTTGRKAIKQWKKITEALDQLKATQLVVRN